jgi:hypothetical protein
MSSRTAPSPSRTLALSVANPGFLLDRLGEDCHPLQFLRELTQNAIEAIQRTDEKTGQITWDVDWPTFLLEGVYKLCVTDTGDGMSGPDMVHYINQLSSSITEQSIKGNYGVGAKIAAATRNHAGLIYLSWKDGRGSMVHLWRDPATGEYGLRQLRTPDGGFSHFAAVEDDVKPEEIAGKGTKVVLQGHRDDQDTMAAPPEAASPSRWIAKYLNSRYFRFPDGIAVKAREGWMNPREDTDRNLLRRLTGQGPYLDQHAASSGSVELRDAKAYWWILKDESALTQNSGFVESAGHVAALYRDELYELATARAGMALLQQFGAILGHKSIVIYVAPEETPSRRLTTSTARTQLLIDSAPLPWSDWASEFREKLPPEIEEHVRRIAAGAATSDHSQSIRERLRQILDLFKLTRYRSTPSGELSVDDSSTVRGGSPRPRSTEPRTKGASSGTRGGTAGGVYSVFLKKDGAPGTQVRPDPFPETRWISVSDHTREPGDLEDRAARYLPDQNLLLINADFRAFVDMIDKYNSQLGAGGAHEIVADAVRGWFEQTLVETVIGIQALQNSQEWSVADIERASSEEALTAAVMPRYHVNFAVRRELGSKLGKLQTG